MLLKQLCRDWLRSSTDSAQPWLRSGVASYDRVTRLQVEEIEEVEAGLATDAQRFFVLTQTDNMWKEHLQARSSTQSCLGMSCLFCIPYVFSPCPYCKGATI